MNHLPKNTPKQHICVGLLAHVDAGKTTLSEAMLYETGQLKQLGRVDHQDAFLDTYSLERARGITIFSKDVYKRQGRPCQGRSSCFRPLAPSQHLQMKGYNPL